MTNQLDKFLAKGQGVLTPQASVFANKPLENADMSSGVAVSFPILGIKGGKWHYRWKGEDTIIQDARGFAVPAINVVLLKSQKELSRTYYPQGSYVEGANNRPSCYSSDGVKPDSDVPSPVNPLCATCPNDAWGSGATPASPKAKACQQRRRVVLVPYGDDLTNETQGGPVMLSVPPSSLRNQDEYAKFLTDNGRQYFGDVTQLSFDQSPNLSFPRIVFSYAQTLTEEEAAVIDQLRTSEQIERILGSRITDNLDVGVGAGTPAANTATGGVSRASNFPSSGSPPPRPQGSVQSVRAAPQPSAPVAAEKAAPAAPVAPQTRLKIGGFAIKQTPIADALASPAAPPPTMRVVKTTPVAEPAADEAISEDKAGGKSAPEELTSLFGKLMSNLGN